ncbi:ComF family protein [Proteiniphilum sp. UBA1028]|mgnify:CR=1 FL=1|jgi:ComF family protein|uniref:ComF family protein n=1 Tax=Proteiniphilum sp. UBA1028 TaxID=1947251 RepID=UPI000E8B4124|nr:ComF family protein [Proteiniphilum sp. UBA1028]HBG56793.1 ComF family protein [Porphyromonadaceae bacterium]
MRRNDLLFELSRLFFPAVCMVCGEELLQSEECICLRCLYKLPRTYNFRLPNNAAEQLMAGRIPFERIASFCVYAKGGILPPLIHQLKYHHHKEVGALLGRIFGEDLLGSDFLKPIDIILPVPLHPKKEKSRGYNQAEMIACGLSEATSRPLSVGNLVRVVYNPTQTRRTKTQRWENVKSIFRVNNPDAFAHKHLLLVDDVITTGSTVEACGIALQACREMKISVATLGEVF